jgi:predicted TIM-barrel fold metal-dependent hydrolase
MTDLPEIWDVHCHLANLPGSTPEERLGRLLEYADRMGIRRVCVYMGMKWSYDPSPADLRQQNDDVLAAIRRWPERAFGFVYLNPKHPRESLDELNRCVADGPMVGVKLWVAAHADDPKLDPLVERAAELQAPVFQHTWIKTTGNLPGESTPMNLVTLAARHPSVKFICGHTGGDWEQGIRAVRASSNISVDLGGGDPVAGITEMAVRELGPERVLFGSDAAGRSFASQLAKVHGAAIPENAKQLIFAANLKRLLEPILATKA